VATARIPTRWMLDTLEAIWSAWTPEQAAAYLERLARPIRSPDVALQPLHSGAS
jgi:hypothetical protein